MENILIEEIVRVDLPTAHGHFKLGGFREKKSSLEHVAVIKGNWSPTDAVLVRVHSSCFTGDVLGSLRCDCGEQLHNALAIIEKIGQGVIIYLDQEGRGIGLMNKLRAYQLQEQGMDTVDANIHLGLPIDNRSYTVAAQILQKLGITKIRLITNNPQKRISLVESGLEVTEIISVITKPNKYNAQYLATKRERMGHTLIKKAMKR